MKCNQAGIALIQSFEGCKLTSYPDQNGIFTIGWGHTGPEVVEGIVWTQDMADSQFLIDLKQRGEDPVNAMVTVPLTDNQFSALCSFVYNIGSGRFKGSSALHLLNNSDYDDVPDHMKLWDEAGGKVDDGLVRRRQAEVDLFNTQEAA